MQPTKTSWIRTSPTFQPTGSRRLKSTRTTTVKAACPAANEIAAGAYDATSTARGKTIHERGMVGADRQDDQAADGEPRDRAQHGADAARSRRQGTRPQHRHGAEHHPEAVLDAEVVSHEDGDGQPEPTAHAVAEPDRVHPQVARRGGAQPWRLTQHPAPRAEVGEAAPGQALEDRSCIGRRRPRRRCAPSGRRSTRSRAGRNEGGASAAPTTGAALHDVGDDGVEARRRGSRRWSMAPSRVSRASAAVPVRSGVERDGTHPCSTATAAVPAWCSSDRSPPRRPDPRRRRRAGSGTRARRPPGPDSGCPR